MMEGGRRLQKHLVPIQTRNILKTSRKCHSSLSRPIYSKSSLLVSSSRNRYKLVSKKANQFNIHRKFCSFQVFRGGQRSNIFNPFSLDLWDPFKFFPFSTSLSNIPNTIGETSAFANTRIDWKETPKAHVFRADLPGVKKEEVKVEVEEGRVLQISGKRSKDQEEKNNKWHRVERSSGKFFRRFRLLENAKTDEVKASMENGVPTVTVSKEEVKKAEVQAIEIST